MALFSYKDFSGGMLAVNPNLAPQNTSGIILNADVDNEIGSIVSRTGRSTVGVQAIDAVTCLGLFQHVDQADSTKNKLFATFDDGVSATNADIYDMEAGTPTVSLANDTRALKTYFLNYNGDTLRLNGTDAPKAYNSTSWITTGGVFDLANMPTAYKYPKEFLSRVYMWGHTTTPYRLIYSGVLTSSAISWTVGNGFVDIEPEDNGGEATGLGKVPGYLLIFKRRSMHRWNYASAFPEALVNIGAYSQTSVIEAGGLCAFYSDSNVNEKGFYVTNGGRPVCISKNNNRPMKKWVDAISSTAVVAGWSTESVFAWSVGAITVDGDAYSNVVFRYNRVLNQWTIRTYPTAFTVFAPYVVSGVNNMTGGDNDGSVYKMDVPGVYTDAVTTTTQAFEWKVRTHFHSYGDNHKKTLLDKIIVRGNNTDSLRLSAYIDDDTKNPISLTRGMWKKILSLFSVGNTIKGTTIAIEVSGTSQGSPTTIREIELASITVDNVYE